jgi:hypothetical protein
MYLWLGLMLPQYASDSGMRTTKICLVYKICVFLLLTPYILKGYDVTVKDLIWTIYQHLI